MKRDLRRKYLNIRKRVLDKSCKDDLIFNKVISDERVLLANDLVEGYKNILEPVGNEKISDFSKALCITPGVCFNRYGYRIGYGGGFYDRFLSRSGVFSIGVCYKECLCDLEFNEEHDVAVNRVITD